MPPAPLKVSFSSLNSYLQCPLKYKMSAVDKVAPAPRSGAGLSFYKSLTAALERFHQEGIKDLPTEAKLLELLQRNWERAGYTDEAEERHHREMAEGILQGFYRDFAREKPNPVYIGVLLNVSTKAWSLSTRADRVDLLPDGTYEAIKYKTGKNVTEAASLAHDLQAVLLFQGANAHKRFSGRVSKVSFYFLRQNRKISTTPSPADIKAVLRSVSETVESIQRLSRPRGPFTRTMEGMVDLLGRVVPVHRTVAADPGDPLSLAEKGPLCSTCEFLEACPAWPAKPRSFCSDSADAYHERIRLSYSKLSSYKRCPRAWKKVYLDGIGLQPRPFFSFGSAMHEAMEIFYDPRGRKKSSLPYLLELWDQVFKKHPAGYRDQEEARSYHRHGVEMIKKFHASFVAKTGYRPAYSVEEYFELPLGKNVVMTGYIDRIDRRDDGSFEIVDYKTEPTRRSQAELDGDDQLTIYFWAAETMLQLKISQLALFMMKFDAKAVTVRRNSDIPQVTAAIDAVAAEMKENIRRHREEHQAAEGECRYFPARKNKYCRSCDYLENCPLQPEILSDEKIRSMEYE
jgi:RecB family exonuclease